MNPPSDGVAGPAGPCVSAVMRKLVKELLNAELKNTRQVKRGQCHAEPYLFPSRFSEGAGLSVAWLSRAV